MELQQYFNKSGGSFTDWCIYIEWSSFQIQCKGVENGCSRKFGSGYIKPCRSTGTFLNVLLIFCSVVWGKLLFGGGGVNIHLKIHKMLESVSETTWHMLIKQNLPLPRTWHQVNSSFLPHEVPQKGGLQISLGDYDVSRTLHADCSTHLLVNCSLSWIPK